MITKLISAPDELPEMAARILETREHNTILFIGELGAGKTTLIKEICLQLKVVDSVGSPSFSIVNQYETNFGDTIYHFDFYRIKSEDEAYDFGAEEYFESGKLCLVEWPNLVPNLIPEDHHTLTIELKEEGRLFSFG